ncbi:signal peptidase I (plasmid) [Pontibacillus sp. ALD_SL1]|uniref:signal peptidase I n=1 Tax=Pontibacillus sp. ALD_SL1 TaxID=2777185 RepID=UPI001A958127|nr:signal peptidase I [Pontibacillus sp. ALD_SL1]QST02951.1 signal peptidase I [Pontibacillus sp. ALD_SL1]
MKELRDWVITILTALLLAFLLKMFLFQFYVVSGQSMEPSYQNRDFVAAVKWGIHDLEYKDVVILPIEDGTEIIKRVVGLEGDIIEIKDGSLFRNDERVEEPYIKEDMITDYGRITVPKDHVFVLGDNRNYSSDSRNFGPFPLSDVKGKVRLEVFDDFGFKNH